MNWDTEELDFSLLKGKILTKVEGNVGDDLICFYCADGTIYELGHIQECCEDVRVEDIAGNFEDILGVEILLAESATNGENPENLENTEILKYQDSFTWTFYKLGTRKGYVDIRWYGESNGYYSEEVTFAQVKKKDQ